MSKKFMAIIAVLPVLLLLSYQSQDIDNGQGSKNELLDDDETLKCAMMFSDSNEGNNAQLIPVEDVSVEDAANLCRTVLGETSEETGFKLAYRYVKTIEVNNRSYYVMIMSWLVDNNHWSYIGEVIVSTSGDEVYSGAINREGNYFFIEKLWESCRDAVP